MFLFLKRRTLYFYGTSSNLSLVWCKRKWFVKFIHEIGGIKQKTLSHEVEVKKLQALKICG